MGKRTAIERVGASEAREAIAKGEAQAIDLRDEETFGRGHIPGAPRADDLDACLELLAEGERVIVACEDGERSARIAAELRERGYEAAAIEGGMEAWIGKRLPLQPGEDEEFKGPKRAIIQ